MRTSPGNGTVYRTSRAEGEGDKPNDKRKPCNRAPPPGRRRRPNKPAARGPTEPNDDEHLGQFLGPRLKPKPESLPSTAIEQS
jgi:hypothetical protein